MNKPLVSIFLNVKNGMRSVERCIRSVLNQDYPNVEFVVQEAASTDGTLDLLRDYFDKFQGRMKILSEPDSCGEEGFFKALQRCSGDFIGSCAADEELLPHACSWAVSNFEQRPDSSAIFGDQYQTDIDGNIKETYAFNEDFSFEKYICHEQVPPFAASFFRRSALEKAGLYTYPWALLGGEYELWVRLGMRGKITHVSGVVTKYAVHPNSSTCRPKMYFDAIEVRKKIIRRLFASPDLPPSLIGKERYATAGMHLWLASSLAWIGLPREASQQLQEAMKYAPDLNVNWAQDIAKSLFGALQSGTQRL